MKHKFDVYISYSPNAFTYEQRAVVSKIEDALTKAGINYWMERECVYGIDASEIPLNIAASDIFVFFSTKDTNKSLWSREEIACAYKLGKTIVIVRMDQASDQEEDLYEPLKYLNNCVEYYIDPFKGKGQTKGIVKLIDTIKKHQEQIKIPAIPPPPIKYQEPGCEDESYNPSPERKDKISPHKQNEVNFGPKISKTKKYSWKRIFSRKKDSFVYSSIFAPAEVKRQSFMMAQVYLHLFEETEQVKSLAQESQKDAERRDYIPLQCKLKRGDKVDVHLNIYGETLLMSDKKSVVWQGSFTKCSFDYFVPKDIDVDELSCVALLSVNGVPVGEMRFITQIVEQPRLLNPEIIAHKYNKVFISYSHQDESRIKFLHEGLELGSVPHFFDRKYLKAGDVFPQVIQDYINSADLFILCWSENASKSEYVQRERLQALERAFPQVQPEKAAELRIYPMSIEPRTELPNDMKDNYHFGEM